MAKRHIHGIHPLFVPPFGPLIGPLGHPCQGRPLLRGPSGPPYGPKGGGHRRAYGPTPYGGPKGVPRGLRRCPSGGGHMGPPKRGPQKGAMCEIPLKRVISRHLGGAKMGSFWTSKKGSFWTPKKGHFGPLKWPFWTPFLRGPIWGANPQAEGWPFGPRWANMGSPPSGGVPNDPIWGVPKGP